MHLLTVYDTIRHSIKLNLLYSRFPTAFGAWKRDQLSPDDLMMLFKVINKQKRLLAKFPSIQDVKFNSKKMGSWENERDIFRNILNEILCKDPGNEVTESEVTAIIDEISSSPDGTISFEDFIRIFTTS